MNSKSLIPIALLSLALSATAANLTPGINPPPVVQFLWDPVPTADGYRLYYGPAPGSYTNVVNLPAVTTFNFTIPTRGDPYNFVLTATAAGLESLPSTNLTYTAKAIPASPNLKPPVTLVVQSRSVSDPSAQWTTLFDAQVPTDDPQGQEYRTKLTLLAEAPPQVAPSLVSRLPSTMIGERPAVLMPPLPQTVINPQVRALHALRKAMQMPPAPTAPKATK